MKSGRGERRDGNKKKNQNTTVEYLRNVDQY